MSEGNWYDAWIAPGIILGIVATIGAVIGWIRTYISGKKTNVKEAKQLAEETIEKAEEKGVKERADAKALYTEKIETATTLEEKRKNEAIDVKNEQREYIGEKFRFSDQEHAHQHAELINKIRNLNTKIEQVSIDLKLFMKQQDDENETCKRKHINGNST